MRRLRCRGGVLGLACLLAGLLAGCGGTAPETLVFSLEAEVIPLPLGEPLPGTLQVQSLSSATVYADRRLAWRDVAKSQQIHLYNHYLWSSAPPRLFQEQLFRCLDEAEAAETLVPSAVSVAIDFVLSGELRRLELLVGARRSTAVVEIDLYLTDRRTRQLLWKKSFDYAEPTTNFSPEATIEAFSNAMTKLCFETVALFRETAALLAP